MNESKKGRRSQVALLTGSLALPLLCGCNHLAFGTATKFGLDITQKPDQTIEVSMGYRRAEMASIPVAKSGEQDKSPADANDTDDAYSVLARFNVIYGNPWKLEGLHLKQFFATGMAARAAATNPAMQEVFGKAAGEIKTKQEEGLK